MTADASGDFDVRPTSALRRLVVPAVALVAGVAIGFAGRSSLGLPSDVVVDGHPSTLHVYRFEPAGALPQPGQGEVVIFDQASISYVVAELNRLPAFPKAGRRCNDSGSFFQLTFDYDNGDAEVNVRPAPCGMVTKHAGQRVVADALDSPLYRELAALLNSR